MLDSSSTACASASASARAASASASVGAASASASAGAASAGAVGTSGCSESGSSQRLLCETFDFATVKDNGYEPAAAGFYHSLKRKTGGRVSGGVGQLLRHTVSYGKYPLITLMDDGTARELYTNYAYLDMASIVDSTFTGLLRRHIKRANGGRAKVCLPANAFLDRGREVCA